jgi:hypothetical protein
MPFRLPEHTFVPAGGRAPASAYRRLQGDRTDVPAPSDDSADRPYPGHGADRGPERLVALAAPDRAPARGPAVAARRPDRGPLRRSRPHPRAPGRRLPRLGSPPDHCRWDPGGPAGVVEVSSDAAGAVEVSGDAAVWPAGRPGRRPSIRPGGAPAVHPDSAAVMGPDRRLAEGLATAGSWWRRPSSMASTAGGLRGLVDPARSLARPDVGWRFPNDGPARRLTRATSPRAGRRYPGDMMGWDG